MIRARALLIRKCIRSRAIRSVSRASSARTIAAAGTVTSPEWTSHGSMTGVVAVAGALILTSIVFDQGKLNDRNSRLSLCHPSSVVQCQAALQDEKDEADNNIRTISLEDITQDPKSLRAYCSAIDHDLFRDELTSDGGVTLVTNSNNNNAITERFVSFSHMALPVNIRPRVSVRHTHRTEEEEESEEKLLATSTGVESPPSAAKSFNTTLGTIAKSQDDTMQPDDPNSVILRKMDTVRRNCDDQVYTKKMYFYKHAAAMEDRVRSKFRLFALPSSESLGKEMAFLLDTELSCIDVGSYNDGETSVKIGDAVRGKNVFVVCSTTSATAIAELLLTLSALRRGSAKRICAILPYYGYSRQDRRTGMKREPIAAADMAYLLEEMGVDSVICVDLHNSLVKGFFSPSVPVDHLSPGPVAAAYFYEEMFGVGDEKKVDPPKITVVAAHENQVSRANVFRNALMKLSGSDDIRVALISNSRALNENTMSDHATIVGDVHGRQCIIVDDIISTGSTMIKAITAVNNAGASEVYAWATHGVLKTGNNVSQKLQQIDALKYLLISNSVAVAKEKEVYPKIRKLSIAPLLSEAVSRALTHESIRTILDLKASESGK